MNWVKGFAVVTCLAAPLPMIVATQAAAETATKAPAAATTNDKAPAASTDDAAKKPAMSKDEFRKLSDKCSDEADAKKLTGDPRKSFRRACLRKGGAKRV